MQFRSARSSVADRRWPALALDGRGVGDQACSVGPSIQANGPGNLLHEIRVVECCRDPSPPIEKFSI